jgi:hypothetical protein
VVLAALLWTLYAYYWSIVGQRPLNPQTATSLAALGVLAGLTIVMLVVWVFHNIRIARRHQRRRLRPPGPSATARDYLGRWIICDHPEQLLEANYIEIDIKTSVIEDRTVEEKIFRMPPGVS